MAFVYISWKCIVGFIFFSFLSEICCDSVLFTNSQSKLERSHESSFEDGLRTYQLDVPGSSPITIIEAEPVKKEGRFERTRKSFPREAIAVDSGQRKTKDYVVPGSSHEQDFEDVSETRKETERCFGSCKDEHNENSRKTVYSPELLNKFLQEYAEKIRNADKKTKEKLHQMEITTTSDDIITDVKYEKHKNEAVDHSEGNRRYSNWDELETKKYRHPYDDPKGWVAMEAVPWTRSKISKWQANTQKINKPNNNYNSYDYDNKDTSTFVDKFSSGYDNANSESDFDTRPAGSFHHFSKPNKYNYKPTYDIADSDDSWPIESSLPKPSWSSNKPLVNRPSYQLDDERKPHRPDCDQHNHDSYNRRVSNIYYDKDGIITDGSPSDFPSSGLDYKTKHSHRKPSQVIYDDEYSYENNQHPSTYPVNGDGQWVLLSTAKGYKFPKQRQRSMSLSPNVLTSHRSIRLTVLPAVNGSKENMTLSHGGLLEVEPSFHTVDESKILYERTKRNTSDVVKNTKRRKIVSKPTDSSIDGSAVMAAVGAGMVPATVAMLMPMVLGRKKRSIVNPFLQSNQNPQNVTLHPHLDFESTLQRTL